MGKQGTIDTFFSKKRTNQLDPVIPIASLLGSNNENLSSESLSKKSKNIDDEGVDLNSLELDPGLRCQIWEYPIGQQDEIRRAYLINDPYQPILSEYPLSVKYNPPRRFQPSWYALFKWLEYSPTKDKAFCKICFIFNKPSGLPNQTTFTVNGFDSWKKVRNGKDCAFLGHVGAKNSSHHINEKACCDLMNQKQYLSRLVETFTTEQVVSNRVRLKASIVLVRLFALQGVAFRGHDESSKSSNRGNFLEFLDVLAIYNEELSNARIKAPQNALYTSHHIQKEILNVLSVRVKNVIREEIGMLSIAYLLMKRAMSRKENKCL